MPAPDDYIDGLIASVPGADWAALDEREGAYARHDASHAVTHPVARDLDIAIYAVDLATYPVPGDDHPILMSYLDVVIQGFHTEFGQAGVDAIELDDQDPKKAAKEGIIALQYHSPGGFEVRYRKIRIKLLGKK